MQETDTKMQRALEAFARADAEDKNTVERNGRRYFGLAYYHERLAYWVQQLTASPSLALRLAARCQHIRRFAIPRERYELGRVGYKQWRSALAQYHAQQAAAILADVGYDADVINRVCALLIKKGLKSDPEVQLFEDAICLTFMETQLEAFAREHDAEKIVQIVQKTWKKMSRAGHTHALTLVSQLTPHTQALVAQAIS